MDGGSKHPLGINAHRATLEDTVDDNDRTRRGISMRAMMIGVALVVVLTGCGGGTGPGAGSGAGPVEAVETIENVDYYYACGNEVLQLPDGRRFYPFVDQDLVNEDAYLGASAPSKSAVRLAATLAVVEPGPGDDTGTLVIYEDGTARFVSDSGIEAWLTNEERTYNWEC